MRISVFALVLFGSSAVGWSALVNVDQSMSAPIELAAFTMSAPPQASVLVSVGFVDLDPNPFVARLAINKGGGLGFDVLPQGMCDILVTPSTPSPQSCTAAGSFFPKGNFQVGFEMFNPPPLNTQASNPENGFWHVTDVSVSVTATNPAPEPASISFVLLGLAAAILLRICKSLRLVLR